MVGSDALRPQRFVVDREFVELPREPVDRATNTPPRPNDEQGCPRPKPERIGARHLAARLPVHFEEATMNTTQVLKLLKANKNPRGIENWKKIEQGSDGLASFGIGLTQLRKLAKKVGRDHVLAQMLWRLDNYDARVIGLLIDDPKKLTRDHAEAQVEDLHHGMLVHVFASCDATLAKTPYVVELSVAWLKHKDPIRRRCGYGLLYEISKDKRKNAPDDAFFLSHVKHIDKTYKMEDPDVMLSIGGALMGIGKRNKTLNQAALKVARKMGPIAHSPQCDPFDVVKHLTSDALTKKLSL
ncbi:DNA alkylation repair protein [Endomicrobium sp. AH-315-J14]|nr:DNA alkylation repair protein [Endomicrobium sp. AH-315-J14]